MTFTDGVILVITACAVGRILYRMFRKKEGSSCEGCSYAKKSK